MNDKRQLATEALFKTFDLPTKIMWKALYAKIHKIYEEGSFTKEEVLRIVHNVIRTKTKLRYDKIKEICPEFLVIPEKKKFDKIDKFEDFLKTGIGKIFEDKKAD